MPSLKNKNTRFQLLRSVGVQGQIGLVLLNQNSVQFSSVQFSRSVVSDSL